MESALPPAFSSRSVLALILEEISAKASLATPKLPDT